MKNNALLNHGDHEDTTTCNYSQVATNDGSKNRVGEVGRGAGVGEPRISMKVD